MSWFALNAIFDTDTIQLATSAARIFIGRGLLSMRSLTRIRSNEFKNRRLRDPSWFALNAIFDTDTIQPRSFQMLKWVGRGLLSMRSLTRIRSNFMWSVGGALRSWFALNAIFDTDTIQQFALLKKAQAVVVCSQCDL